MIDLRGFLENWIYGLFGYEERTFITVRHLVKQLLDEDIVKMKSEFVDYEENARYEFDLVMKKTPISNEENIKYDEDIGEMGRLIREHDSITNYDEYWQKKIKHMED